MDASPELVMGIPYVGIPYMRNSYRDILLLLL